MTRLTSFVLCLGIALGCSVIAQARVHAQERASGQDAATDQDKTPDAAAPAETPPRAEPTPPVEPPRAEPMPGAESTPPPSPPARVAPGPGGPPAVNPPAPGRTAPPAAPPPGRVHLGPGSPAVAPEGVVPPVMRPARSAFVVPSGLSRSSDELLALLGYYPGTCIPLTPESCFDLAYACYIREMYSDAAVLAAHGLTMCHDARLFLLKGVCELHLGSCTKAEETAFEYRTALAENQTFGLSTARERVNDSLRVRFDAIVRFQDTGR